MDEIIYLALVLETEIERYLAEREMLIQAMTIVLILDVEDICIREANKG